MPRQNKKVDWRHRTCPGTGSPAAQVTAPVRYLHPGDGSTAMPARGTCAHCGRTVSLSKRYGTVMAHLAGQG
jgi:cytochrome c5